MDNFSEKLQKLKEEFEQGEPTDPFWGIEDNSCSNCSLHYAYGYERGRYELIEELLDEVTPT